MRSLLPFFLVAAFIPGFQDPPRRAWDEQQRTASAAELAARLESAERPVYRYRVAIVGLMQLKPGMSAAEIGAGSGFLARMMAKAVGPEGRVVATELNEKLVAHMAERARAEGLSNFAALKGENADTGLAPGSADAIAMVNTYSYLERPPDILRSAAAALRPDGLLLIVDFPRSGEGADESGVDAEEVMQAAKAAGLTFVNENGIVPGHFALRFRKPASR